MTPDLPTRVREAIMEAVAVEFGACSSTTADRIGAAVIAVVQEDRTREIARFVRQHQYVSSVQRTGRVWASVADAITREFGGTTHD